MEALIKVSTPMKYAQGSKVCTYDGDQSMMYIIAAGQLCVMTEDQGEHNYEKLILSKGEFFGGLGLVAGGKKVIEAVALSEAVVLETSMERVKEYKTANTDGGLLYVELMKMYNVFSQKIKAAIIEGGGDGGSAEVEAAGAYLSIESVTTNKLQHTMVLMKSFKCPICAEEFQSHSVRETKLQIDKRGDFFMNEFKDIDPLWYDIIVCPECGYAEKVSEFAKPIKYNVAKIKKAMSDYKEAMGVAYSDYRTSLEVSKAFHLYEKCLIEKDVNEKAMARGALTSYEFFRRLGDEVKSAEYRDKAFGYYKGMFKSGILDVTDSQMQQLYIIIGKLHEHREEYEEAKGEYRNAKMLRGDVDPKYAELAEDFLMDLEDLISEKG